MVDKAIKKNGRPLEFETVEELESAIDKYFDDCTINKEHPTVSGLAVALNVDRKTITNYQNRELFFPTIKAAKARIESHLEQCLFGSSVTGVIFNLKNNFEWKDKTETALTGSEGGPIEVAQTKFIFVDAVDHKNTEVSQAPENKTKRLKSPPAGDKPVKAKPKSKPNKLRKTAK